MEESYYEGLVYFRIRLLREKLEEVGVVLYDYMKFFFGGGVELIDFGK